MNDVDRYPAFVSIAVDMNLPSWITAALNKQLEGISRAALRDRATLISDAYRNKGTSKVIGSKLDALSYAVVRMPATFSAIRAALGHAVEAVPDFRPVSLLDVGAGPGTATWAAFEAWPSIRQATLLDHNSNLLDMALGLGGSAIGSDVTLSYVRGDAQSKLRDMAKADLVLAGYAFTEMARGDMERVLTDAWDLTDDVLVIIEPGTPAGFQRLLECRDLLLNNCAAVVAPCSHEGTCPLAASARWCHFSERLSRSRDHLVVKAASVPFEDEKYAYLVAAKSTAQIDRGRRILATPKVNKGSVALTLCAPDAVEERLVQRGRKELYKLAKRSDWGDLWKEKG